MRARRECKQVRVKWKWEYECECEWKSIINNKRVWKVNLLRQAFSFLFWVICNFGYELHRLRQKEEKDEERGSESNRESKKRESGWEWKWERRINQEQSKIGIGMNSWEILVS